MKEKSTFKKVVHGYDCLEEYLLVGSLVFNVLLVFIQVIMRAVFKNSLSWSEELSRYVFIWQIWLGTSIALRYDEHIKVTMIYSLIKNKRIQSVIRTFADICWFAFCGYMIFNGIELVQSMVSRNAVSSGLRVPLSVVYSVFPIASLLVCIRLLPILMKDVKAIVGKTEDEANDGEGDKV